MANPTYAQLRTLLGGGTIPSEDFNSRLLTLLAIIASAQNPDGSAVTGPTSIADIQKSTPLVVSGTAVAVNDNAIPVTEVFGRWVSVQLTGTWVATLAFEASNDGTNWVAVVLENIASAVNANLFNSATSNQLVHGPICTRYFRVRCSAYTSGTVVATAIISALPAALTNLSVDTELPTATALGTALGGNAPAVLSVLHLWDNATGTNAMTSVASVSDNSVGGRILPSSTCAYTGTGYDRLRTPNVFKSPNNLGISTESNVWIPATGKKFRLMGGTLASSVAGNVILRDGAGGSVIAIIPTLAGAPTTFARGNGQLSAAANNVLTATGPSTATLSGEVYGTEE